MNTNPILEETWRIKEQLAAEAGYDVNRFCEQLRAWSEAHPHLVPPVKEAGKVYEEDGAALVLREEPPKPGDTHTRGIDGSLHL